MNASKIAQVNFVGRTLLVVPQRSLKLGQIPVLVRECNGAHRLDVSKLGKLQCQLDRQEGCHIFGLKYIFVSLNS